MLPLDDPLWAKLDNAYGLTDIPKRIERLLKEWWDADGLLWSTLWHQQTIYGATYAAVPHLLAFAEQSDDRPKRGAIALFCGAVALEAFETWTPGEPLPALPREAAGWEAKLDLYRGIAARGAGASAERAARRLAIGPVTERELPKILEIELEFLRSVGRIRALIVAQLPVADLESGEFPHLLKSLAALDGLFSLARYFDTGGETGGACRACGASWGYGRFNDGLALYLDAARPGLEDDRRLRDWKEGAPAHCDLMVGCADPRPKDERIAALLGHAKAHPPERGLWFLETAFTPFRCPACQAETTLCAIDPPLRIPV